MADAKKFRTQLSSSRFIDYTKGQSEDISNKKISDKKYNMMTASWESKEYLEDSLSFGVTAPLMYQMDEMQQDLDDIHSHLSESVHTNKDQNFEGNLKVESGNIYVDGNQVVRSNQTASMFTNLKGDKGDTGATGATGAKGSTGAQGAQGPKGMKGKKGDQGVSGWTFTQGTGKNAGTLTITNGSKTWTITGGT